MLEGTETQFQRHPIPATSWAGTEGEADVGLRKSKGPWRISRSLSGEKCQKTMGFLAREQHVQRLRGRREQDEFWKGLIIRQSGQSWWGMRLGSL